MLSCARARAANWVRCKVAVSLDTNYGSEMQVVMCPGLPTQSSHKHDHAGQLWHYTFILAVNIDSIQLQQLIETLIVYIKISSDPILGRDKGYQWIEWIQWQCT